MLLPFIDDNKHISNLSLQTLQLRHFIKFWHQTKEVYFFPLVTISAKINFVTKNSSMKYSANEKEGNWVFSWCSLLYMRHVFLPVNYE